VLSSEVESIRSSGRSLSAIEATLGLVVVVMAPVVRFAVLVVDAAEPPFAGALMISSMPTPDMQEVILLGKDLIGRALEGADAFALVVNLGVHRAGEVGTQPQAVIEVASADIGAEVAGIDTGRHVGRRGAFHEQRVV